MLSMNEASLQNLVLLACRRMGLLCVHHYGGGKASLPGSPDLLISGWTPGGLLVRELKSRNGHLSPHQMNWGMSLSITGDYGVWTPDDWESGRIIKELVALLPEKDSQRALKKVESLLPEKVEEYEEDLAA